MSKLSIKNKYRITNEKERIIIDADLTTKGLFLSKPNNGRVITNERINIEE